MRINVSLAKFNANVLGNKFFLSVLNRCFLTNILTSGALLFMSPSLYTLPGFIAALGTLEYQNVILQALKEVT